MCPRLYMGQNVFRRRRRLQPRLYRCVCVFFLYKYCCRSGRESASPMQAASEDMEENSVSSETERSELSQHHNSTLFMLQFAIEQMSLEVTCSLYYSHIDFAIQNQNTNNCNNACCYTGAVNGPQHRRSASLRSEGCSHCSSSRPVPLPVSALAATSGRAADVRAGFRAARR